MTDLGYAVRLDTPAFSWSIEDDAPLGQQQQHAGLPRHFVSRAAARASQRTDFRSELTGEAVRWVRRYGWNMAGDQLTRQDAQQRMGFQNAGWVADQR
jgi:hypothetical protein